MKVARILKFGSAEGIPNTDVARPTPGRGQAAGVGPWDAQALQEPSTTYLSFTYP